MGHTEGGRYRVEREQQIRCRDCDHHDEHRCGETLAVYSHPEFGAVVLLGHWGPAANALDDEVVHWVGVFVPVPKQADTGVDQDGTEDHEREREGCQGRSTYGNEYGAKDQRQDDPDK